LGVTVGEAVPIFEYPDRIADGENLQRRRVGAQRGGTHRGGGNEEGENMKFMKLNGHRFLLSNIP